MQNNADDQLILVNENDEIIGYSDKYTTHYQKRLHRAFSLFLYDVKTNQVLLHQRAMNKYHSVGLWTNSCCSHPRKNEQLTEAVVRRAYEELGIKLLENDIIQAGHFTYLADFGELAEYEIDQVVYAYVDHNIEFNVDNSEIMAYKWVDVDQIHNHIEDEPETFSAWFPQAFSYFYQAINEGDNNEKMD